MTSIRASTSGVTVQKAVHVEIPREEQNKKFKERMQQVWAVGVSLGLASTAYGFFSRDYRSILGGLSLFGIQVVGYAGYLVNATGSRGFHQTKARK